LDLLVNFSILHQYVLFISFQVLRTDHLILLNISYKKFNNHQRSLIFY